MKKIILYEDGPKILSNRFYFIIFLIPLIVFGILNKTNLLILSVLLITSVVIIFYSLTALNSGDAIIIKDHDIYSWNKYVKTRIKKEINISDIERIQIDEPYLLMKTRNNTEKEYFYKSTQKVCLLRFLDQNQIQMIICE